MRFSALALLPVAILTHSCGDVWLPPEQSPGCWRQSFALTKDFIGDFGAVAAESGDRVLVAWQQRLFPSEAQFIDEIMVAIMSVDGVVMVEPHLVDGPIKVLVLAATATATGFLLFTSDFQTLRATSLDRDGNIVSRQELALNVWSKTQIVGDEAGATVLSSVANGEDLALTVSRIDDEARLVSTSPMVTAVNWCNDIVNAAEGRLLAWCFQRDLGGPERDQTLVLLEVGVDGSTPNSITLPRAAYPPRVARLARVDEVIVAAFEAEGEVRAATFGLDGAPIVAPFVVASAGPGEFLQGDAVCQGGSACDAFTLISAAGGARLGFEVIENSSRVIEVRFASLAIGSDSATATIDTDATLRPGRAHHASIARGNRIVTTLSGPDGFGPWAVADRVLVDRACSEP